MLVPVCGEYLFFLFTGQVWVSRPYLSVGGADRSLPAAPNHKESNLLGYGRKPKLTTTTPRKQVYYMHHLYLYGGEQRRSEMPLVVRIYIGLLVFSLVKILCKLNSST